MNPKSSHGSEGGTSNDGADSADRRQSASVVPDDSKESETYQQSKPSVQGFAKEAFILLNQERYTEHNAAVLLCEVSPRGSVVATVDAAKCLKVWSVSPSPTTKAALVLDSAPTCLSWDQDGDSDVLFLGFEGKLSQLKIDSLSFTDFELKGDYTRVLTLATMSEMLACSFGDKDKASKEGSLVLLDTKKFDADVSAQSLSLNYFFSSFFLFTLFLFIRFLSLASTTRFYNYFIYIPFFPLPFIHPFWSPKKCGIIPPKAPVPIRSHAARVNCFHFNHNGTLLVAGFVDGMVRIIGNVC